MKQFDWEEAATRNSPEKLAWLKENHNKPITVDEYVAAMKAIRQERNSPSHLRNNYRRLQTFGFFS